MADAPPLKRQKTTKTSVQKWTKLRIKVTPNDSLPWTLEKPNTTPDGEQFRPDELVTLTAPLEEQSKEVKALIKDLLKVAVSAGHAHPLQQDYNNRYATAGVDVNQMIAVANSIYNKEWLENIVRWMTERIDFRKRNMNGSWFKKAVHDFALHVSRSGEVPKTLIPVVSKHRCEDILNYLNRNLQRDSGNDETLRYFKVKSKEMFQNDKDLLKELHTFHKQFQQQRRKKDLHGLDWTWMKSLLNKETAWLLYYRGKHGIKACEIVATSATVYEWTTASVGDILASLSMTDSDQKIGVSLRAASLALLADKNHAFCDISILLNKEGQNIGQCVNTKKFGFRWVEESIGPQQDSYCRHAMLFDNSRNKESWEIMPANNGDSGNRESSSISSTKSSTKSSTSSTKSSSSTIEVAVTVTTNTATSLAHGRSLQPTNTDHGCWIMKTLLSDHGSQAEKKRKRRDDEWNNRYKKPTYSLFKVEVKKSGFHTFAISQFGNRLLKRKADYKYANVIAYLVK